MMAYGGPNSLDDVEAYLTDVLGGRQPAPAHVAAARKRYAAIGGRSPLLEITQAQANGLEEELNRTPQQRWRVYAGMRHWHPYIRQAIAEMASAGEQDVIALCMTPQYSRRSVGAYQQKVREALAEMGTAMSVTYVDSWHKNALFSEAIGAKIRMALDRFAASDRPGVHIVFTAHSLPAAIIEQGDPYDAQVRETAWLVASRLGLRPEQWRVAYQCAGGGNMPWLGPDLMETIGELAGQCSNILVAPVGYVADHVEILYDLDIEARSFAAARGVRLERTDSLNADPAFIAALAAIVRQAIASK